MLTPGQRLVRCDVELILGGLDPDESDMDRYPRYPFTPRSLPQPLLLHEPAQQVPRPSLLSPWLGTLQFHRLGPKKPGATISLFCCRWPRQFRSCHGLPCWISLPLYPGDPDGQRHLSQLPWLGVLLGGREEIRYGVVLSESIGRRQGIHYAVGRVRSNISLPSSSARFASLRQGGRHPHKRNRRRAFRLLCTLELATAKSLPGDHAWLCGS
ncbi:hypothetical protein EDB80DRAFT_431933 [Ilyonectria destructans]|nr:hypothetical protein EDB80DRAFT_431933 [Ilyonectria destructans]